MTKTISIKLPEDSWQRLEALRIDIGADTISEVLGNAIRLYEACVKEMGDGAEIVVHRLDGIHVVAMGDDE